jgi:hypothetical protein
LQRRSELGLREQEEVVGAAAPHGQRRHDPPLRGQQKRVAGGVHLHRGDLVGKHPLEVVGGVRTANGDERSRPAGYVQRGSRHGN